MEVPYVSKEVSNVVQLDLLMIVMKMVEGSRLTWGSSKRGCGHQGCQIYKHLKGHLKLRQSGRSEILSHGAADMVMVVADT